MRSPTRRAAAAAFALSLAATSCTATSPDTVVASIVGQAMEETPETVVESPPTTVPIQAAPDSESAPETAKIAGAEPVAVEPAGSEQAEAEPVETQPESPAASPAEVTIRLPDVSVVDLSTGEAVDLGEFVRPGPTLVWFWAPH